MCHITNHGFKRSGYLLIISFLFLSIASVAQNKTYFPVAVNNCGVDSTQAFLVSGDDYTFVVNPDVSAKAATCNFGTKVIYAFDKVDIKADYRLELVFYSDNERVEQVVADGNVILGPIHLEAGKEKRYLIDIPQKAFAYGQLVLNFELISGSNAVVSEVNLYSTNKQSLVPFSFERRTALRRSDNYTVDTTVNVEKVLPVYTPFPTHVQDVYEPVLSLNGIWSFNEKPAAEFWKLTSVPDSWKTIVVPGQWNMQGYKVDSATYAGYMKTFSLPNDWKGKRVKIRFDGVFSESEVYVNGIEVGRHLGGMTPFMVDITSALHQGSNVLAVRVKSESLADLLGSLTQYAAHQLGGITRKVTLFVVPETHLSDIRIVTDLDKDYRDALLKVFVGITNNSTRSVNNCSLRICVDGTDVVLEKSIPQIAAGASWKGWVEMPVNQPLKWDNEHPNLYRLKLELNQDGNVTEQVSKQFGFREIQIKGNEVFVNGKAIKLRGVCRHESHPLTGRVISPELSRKDVELYRNANCNFIRTSHYPPSEEFLDACDEAGLFVEVEAPVCWVGHHANANWKTLNYKDSKYYPYVLQANMENIQFNRNHASVIFWSIANESYWNKEFAQVLEYVKKADTSRPSTFHDQAYGGFNNQGSTAPIANIHYPGPSGYKVAAKSERPMIYGEYCHLNVYNRRELVTDPGVRLDWALALAPTWDNMYKTKGVLGGSIWSGIDDIFQLPDGRAVGYGAWGPIDGWRREKPEYWDLKKSYSPVRLLTKHLSDNQPFALDVENRLTFSNLNELKTEWKYGEEHGVLSVDAVPGSVVHFTINTQQTSKSDELHILFRDPRGFVVDEYSVPVGNKISEVDEKIPFQKTKLTTTADKFVISGSNYTCEISRSTGQLISLRKNNKVVLNGGPYLMVLPLDGDGCLPEYNANIPPFNDVCTGWKLKEIHAELRNDTAFVNVQGTYKEMEGNYAILLNSNGVSAISYKFRSLENVNPRQWGLVFETPVGFSRTFWRRDALWSVYPQNHIGRPVGEAQLFYPDVLPTLPGNREPSWDWSKDANSLGSADFRSTRRNIHVAGLRNPTGGKITVLSSGKQHFRAWLNDDKIRFLVADFVSPGNEMFLGGYFSQYRKPLKPNDEIKGTVMLRAE